MYIKLLFYLYIIQITLKQNTMTNLINTISKELKSEIKPFQVTEIYILNNECYVTSNYDMPFELIAKIESEIL